MYFEEFDRCGDVAELDVADARRGQVYVSGGFGDGKGAEYLASGGLACDAGGQVGRRTEYVSTSLNERAMVQSSPRYGEGRCGEALGQKPA